MNQELTILLIAASSIGFIHTILGPDHYLPFIMMARAGKWSLLKTAWVTVLCGFGHVGSSVILGAIGILLGISITRLEFLESIRGNFAAWALIAFGLIYFVWGLRKALRNKPHEHPHDHLNGTRHSHLHVHGKYHVHVHDEEGGKGISPWILFVIFVLGPCEPLIPILMYPAAKESVSGLILVTAIFGIVTIVTMLAVVLIATFGINLMYLGRLEKYSHAIAGAMICLSGLGIQFMGL
jgi:nickel/cobalt exporter